MNLPLSSLEIRRSGGKGCGKGWQERRRKRASRSIHHFRQGVKMRFFNEVHAHQRTVGSQTEQRRTILTRGMMKQQDEQHEEREAVRSTREESARDMSR